jgi:hypothetical protein
MGRRRERPADGPDLFDAFGTEEKTLHANMGGHTGVPQFEGDDGNRFSARHPR